ncbi:MAG: diphosphomevalonate decarboxylase [Kiritimatiellaeota bacterium]|nr:diphosphomevalonate decarboxylase [Kiritimatiellota bacterium]
MVRRLLGRRPSAVGRAGSAFAPANIALCKYWGKRDEELHLPITSSLSLSLGRLGSEIRLAPCTQGDRISLNGRRLAPDDVFVQRATAFLDLFRPVPDFFFEVRAKNSIPTAAGLASSASGFAALTLALNDLFRWKLARRALSILARLGSGSACRSLYRGFVEWHAGQARDGMDSYAEPLAATWPDLRMGLLLLSEKEKPISSRQAMQQTCRTSPLYGAWPAQAGRDLATLKTALRHRDFVALGRTAEANALAMHATMIAARPAILYWWPASLAAMRQAHQLRADGVQVYFTMDAGPNVKLLFLRRDQAAVADAFPRMKIVRPFGR